MHQLFYLSFIIASSSTSFILMHFPGTLFSLPCFIICLTFSEKSYKSISFEIIDNLFAKLAIVSISIPCISVSVLSRISLAILFKVFFIYLSLYLFICLSLSLYLSIYLSIYRSIDRSIYLSIYLSISSTKQLSIELRKKLI